jgi:hypothetical protein
VKERRRRTAAPPKEAGAVGYHPEAMADIKPGEPVERRVKMKNKRRFNRFFVSVTCCLGQHTLLYGYKSKKKSRE